MKLESSILSSSRKELSGKSMVGAVFMDDRCVEETTKKGTTVFQGGGGGGGGAGVRECAKLMLRELRERFSKF